MSGRVKFCDEEMGLTLGSINYPQAEIYSINCDSKIIAKTLNNNKILKSLQ